MTELETKIKIANLCIRHYKARKYIYLDSVKPKNIPELVLEDQSLMLTIWDLMRKYELVSESAEDEHKKNRIVVPNTLYSEMRNLMEERVRAKSLEKGKE